MRAAFVILCTLCVACVGRSHQDVLTVSVATSLGDVLNELVARHAATRGVRVQLNVGASNTLARQITNGAAVDLFISADEAQMDVVERAGRLVAGSRVNLVSNQLVVITSPDAKATVTTPSDLASADIRRIALGHPDSVPAGVYARQWLETRGLWSAVQPKVIPLPTVRAALAAVREQRAEAAVVYTTDVRTAPEVVASYVVPIGEAPRISYPAAVVIGPRDDAAAEFLKFLLSDAAQQAFTAAGFLGAQR